MDTTKARATSYEVLERFLTGYWTPRTRANYRFILIRWLDWCHEHRYDRSVALTRPRSRPSSLN